MSSDETNVVYERFPERDGHELEIDDYGVDLRVDMSEDLNDRQIKFCSRVAVFMSSLLLALNIANECWGSKPEFTDTNVLRSYDVVADVSMTNMYTVQ